MELGIVLYIIGAVLTYGLFRGMRYKKYPDLKWDKERIILLIIAPALSWLGFVMLLSIAKSERIPVSFRFWAPKNS